MVWPSPKCPPDAFSQASALQFTSLPAGSYVPAAGQCLDSEERSLPGEAGAAEPCLAGLAGQTGGTCFRLLPQSKQADLLTMLLLCPCPLPSAEAQRAGQQLPALWASLLLRKCVCSTRGPSKQRSTGSEVHLRGPHLKLPWLPCKCSHCRLPALQILLFVLQTLTNNLLLAKDEFRVGGLGRIGQGKAHSQCNRHNRSTRTSDQYHFSHEGTSATEPIQK